MNLRKNIRIVLFFISFFFFFAKNVLGVSNSFVNVVNPVRGGEFFNPQPEDLLFGAKIQKQLVEKYEINATWLLRYDILNSSFISFFKDFSLNQEMGLFMEITPSLAKAVDIGYPQGGVFWHDANKIFLSGYKPEERIKIIDKIFEKFKQEFGYYPKSIGAWHIDAYSASYMRLKYGVTGILICADQFGTDNYQIWGGWWGVPYYPSKLNILMPAQTIKNKLDLVVFWWAARDPLLGYGGSVEQSTYSVQVNDYLQHGLDINYFGKLLDDYLINTKNQFGQITVGLENDMDFVLLQKDYEKQLKEISERKKKGEILITTMTEFSDWYRKRFSNISPDHYLNNWIMSTNFRLGFLNNDGRKIIKDLRIYNEKWPEANLMTANPWGTLSLNNPYKIDTVRFENSFVGANFEINAKEVVKMYGEQKIPFSISKIALFFCYLVFLLSCFLLIKNFKLSLLILVGSIVLSIPIIKSGLVYDYGMGFWGPNGHDGIWHLALINQLKNFSFDNPIFSGTRLINYHFGFDLVVSFLSRLTGLDPVNLYFQILPPIMAVLIGVFTYKFVKKWIDSETTALWSVFFVYFGGSWGWLLGKGESTFWANQAISSLINPPYAFSLIILLAGLIKFLDFLKTTDKKNLFVCVFLFGVLIQIKVYAGIIALGSLFILWIWNIFWRKNEITKIGKLAFLSGFFSLLIFLPFNFRASSFLIFSPLWFPRTMISFSDRLGWFKLENARIAYLNSDRWIKWILAEGLALLIFIFGNLGTRLTGFFYKGLLNKSKKSIFQIEIFLFSFLVVSLVIPLFFIQKGNPWNTIQFFYYFQFLMAIFSGAVVGQFFEITGKIKKMAIGIILVILTLPTTLITLKNDYLPSRPPSRISIEELEALNFLKNQPAGIVLSYPFNPEWRIKFSEPKPLYAYETTAYVSALSGQQSFLADEMNLEITGFDWKTRRNDVERFFLTADQEWGNLYLRENKIKYIYLVKGQKMNLGLGDIEVEKIFENGEVVIFEVK